MGNNAGDLIRVGALKDIAEGLQNNKIVNVYGEGGVGKTTALLIIAENHVEQGTENDAKKIIKNIGIKTIYYTDVSACVSDYEICNNIVNIVERKAKVKFTKFHIIYQWYIEKRKFGFHKRETDIKKDIGEVISSAFGFDIGIFSKNMGEESEQGINKIISKLINGETIYSLISNGINLSSLIKYLYSLGKKLKEEKIYKELLGLVEGCNSDLNYRKALRKCLIAEWKEMCEEKKINQSTILFIIDNYRLQYSRELSYSTAWLKELAEGMEQYWIIGSRTEIEARYQDNISSIKILGFEGAEARNYIDNRIDWKKLKKSYEEKSKYNNREGEDKKEYEEFETDLKKQIQQVCINEIGEEGNNKYLPYKLNLVVTFINQRIANEEEIAVDDIVEYSKSSDFVDYYYFSHMSEMVIAAVQLLSCIPAWNKEMYDLLKSKFNFHYLEAEYLMSKCAFVEYRNGVMKLHEAIRDALYNSESNYIVVDVNNYLYEELTSKLLNEKVGNLVIDYFDIAEKYLEKFKNKVELCNKNIDKFTKNGNKELCNKERIKLQECEEVYNIELARFKVNLKEIHSIYGKKENVTLEYAERYYKVLEFVYDKNTVEYIENKLKCADLYTHLYMPETACKMEEECLKQLEETFKEEECLRVQAYNWTSYDSSKNWDYDNAYTWGKDGLEYAHKIIQNAADNLKGKIPENVSKALEHIIQVYNDKVDLIGENSFLNSLYKSEGEVTTLSVKEFEEDYYVIKEEYKKRKENEENKKKEKKNKENKESEEKKELEKIINLFEDQYSKLRGNFPWYCIKTTKDIQQIDMVRYGINTYYIRRSIFRTNQRMGSKKEYDDLVLKSYENIAKYLFKKKSTGEEFKRQLDDAILILEEAIQKRSYTLSITNEKDNLEREQRKVEILDRKIDKEMIGKGDSENKGEETSGKGLEDNVDAGNSPKQKEYIKEVKLSQWDMIDKMCTHCKYLYDKFGFTKNIWNLSYRKDEVVEVYSYLGDMYISKRWYYEALEKLSFVLLQNYVENSIYTSITMDAYCRASVALCGLNEYVLAKEFIDVVCELSKDNKIQCPKSKKEEFEKVKEFIKNNESVDKIDAILT